MENVSSSFYNIKLLSVEENMKIAVVVVLAVTLVSIVIGVLLGILRSQGNSARLAAGKHHLPVVRKI